MRRVLLAFFTLTLFALSGYSNKSKSALVSIELPANADEAERFAAEELSAYLARIADLDISIGTGRGHRIILGRYERPAGKIRALKEDGFTISSDGKDVRIIGNGPRGVLYGAYAFLEELGVRWYFPGNKYEFVPRLQRINWNRLRSVSESPATDKRILYYVPMRYEADRDWIDFAAKARLNRIAFLYDASDPDWYFNRRDELLSECRKRGLETEDRKSVV